MPWLQSLGDLGTEMTISPGRAVQTAVIQHWHPTMSANGSHGHWATHQKKHNIDRDMAWACARQAGWEFVPGRVRLTITLVYPRRYRVDADNLVAKCKGLIDGLKTLHYGGGFNLTPVIRRSGFFTDDSTEWLELIVRAVVEPGVKETRLQLEPV